MPKADGFLLSFSSIGANQAEYNILSSMYETCKNMIFLFELTDLKAITSCYQNVVMGYSNNNCIGCVKGGCGYWNKIRKDFPDVFADRAKMEREIGHSILHNENGMIFLDDLDPNAGRMSDEIMEDCSIFCQLAMQ